MSSLLVGRFLKDVREKLSLGVRDVQETSDLIAQSEKNREFYISAARLTQIENQQSVPSVFKLFTLSTVYRLDFYDLLRRFGLNTEHIRHYQSLQPLDVTHPTVAEVHDREATITLPVRLDPSFRWETTQLVNRVVELWGEIPAAFLIQLNPHRHMYGFIGLRDFTMFPLIRPGALVMIDERRRRVRRQGWRNEFERPIYFVELRDGYRCAWCQVEGHCLTLLPHPMSPAAAESFTLPDEVEVVGQVVGVAMRLVPAGERGQDNAGELPRLPSSVK